MSTPTDLDFAWAAGFLDGEGCFGIGKRTQTLRTRAPSVVYAGYVTASQVDPAPICRLRAMFGGSVAVQRSRKPRTADTYRWRVGSQLAAAAIRSILPYLVVKHRSAALLLELHAAIQGAPGGSRPLSKVALAQREELYQAAKAANKTGVPRGDAIALPRKRPPAPQLRLVQ